MEIFIQKKEQITIVLIQGRLDSITSEYLQEKVEGLLEKKSKQVLIDFSDLIFISSAGVRVLIKVVKQAKSNSGRLAFCSMSNKVAQVINILGLVQIFPIYQDQNDALNNYFMD